MRRLTLALVAANLLWGSLAAQEQDTYRRKTREMREQQQREDKKREDAKKSEDAKKRARRAK